MTMTIDTATVTGADVPQESATKRPRSTHSHVNPKLNGFSAPQPLAPLQTRMKRKYRHVAAVHSSPKTSCLSHDSETTPSFLGFRNLMVLVLSKYSEISPRGYIPDISNSRWKPAIGDREH